MFNMLSTTVPNCVIYASKLTLMVYGLSLSLGTSRTGLAEQGSALRLQLGTWL